MNVGDYTALLKAALTHDDSRVRELGQQVVANLKSKGNVTAARQVSWALQTQSLTPLPLKTCGAIVNTPPECRLSELMFSREIRQSLHQLLAEQRHRERLARAGFTAASRLLLHGPPGNGKTSIAHGVAAELQIPLLVVSMPELIGSKLGELTQGFAAALTAVKSFGRCVFLIDEADTLLLKRTGGTQACEVENARCTSVALCELERLGSQVITFAATNLLCAIDPALFRRFDQVLELPAPEPSALQLFAESLAKRYGTDLSGISLGNNFATAKQAVLCRAKTNLLMLLGT